MRAMTNRVLIDMVKNHRDTVMAIKAHYVTCTVVWRLGFEAKENPSLILDG